MKDETNCLIGMLICCFFGGLTAVVGDISTASVWLVGVLWAYIASRSAKQVDKLTVNLNEVNDIMEKLKSKNKKQHTTKMIQ